MFDPWVGKISWRKKWKPTSIFLPGSSMDREPGGLQSMVSELDVTKQLITHTQCWDPWVQSHGLRGGAKLRRKKKKRKKTRVSDLLIRVK